jgi:histidinol-phosphate aminotransferase
MTADAESRAGAGSLQDLVARWVRPQIRDIAAYHVPPAAGLIKLDAMENPYPWPEEMVAEWLEVLRGVELNRYPDASASQLKQRLREFMAVPEGMALVLGNGSDELIQMVQLALAGPGRSVLAPTPSFVMYEMIAAFTGLEFVGVPLTGDFSLDAEAMCEAVARHRPAVVFLAYPNNPTGNLFDPGAMERVIRACEGLVVVDEAYDAFSGATFMDRLGEFDNLLVMRTVSKLGLAGLRLGVLAGRPEWLDEFDKVRLPYNINALTQLSAEFALRHREVLDGQVAAICAERTRLAGALGAMKDIEVFPSRANFILFRLADRDAGAVFTALRDAGVLIKNLHRPATALAGCLRVTVGRPEENDAFLEALARALEL